MNNSNNILYNKPVYKGFKSTDSIDKGIFGNIVKEIHTDITVNNNDMNINMLNDINSNIDKVNDFKAKDFKNKYGKGYLSYLYTDRSFFNDFVFKYDREVDKMGVDKVGLRRCVVNYLKMFDDDLIYSVLFIARGFNNTLNKNEHFTLSKEAIKISADTDVSFLVDKLYVDITTFLNVYLSNYSRENLVFDIVAREKVWISEFEYGKDKFNLIKSEIISKQKQIFNKGILPLNTNSLDSNIAKGLKGLKFYDFNLSYNVLFEKVLFFNNTMNNWIIQEITNTLSRDVEVGDMLKYNWFTKNGLDIVQDNLILFYNSLYNEGEYVIDVNEDIKVRFKNIDDGQLTKKLLENVSDKNVIIREGGILKGGEKIVSWIDVISLDISMDEMKEILNGKVDNFNKDDRLKKRMFNIYKSLFSFKVVKRLVDKNVEMDFNTSLDEGVNNIRVYNLMNLIRTNSVFSKERAIELVNELINPKNDINIFNNVKFQYKLPYMDEMSRDSLFDNKIGALDLETYTVDDEGNQAVYCGGWRAKESIHIYKLNEGGCINQDILIEKMFVDILDKGFSDYTFYAHNSKNFDAQFIVSSLLKSNLFDVNKSELNNGKIILDVVLENDSYSIIELVLKRKIKINNKFKIQKIKLLDSNKLIPGKLDNIAKDILGSDVRKGIFPHRFLYCKDNVFYKGNYPDFKYFDNINREEYNNLVKMDNNIFDVQDKAATYLLNDINILFESLIVFAKQFYDNYGVNITKRKSISGLALLTYQSNFYNGKSHKIPILSNRLDSIIRGSYMGGMVQLGAHTCDKAFYYDVNSQYPAAMLQDMPVGQPYFVNNIKLNECFGFVSANITAPSKDELLMPILPRKLPNGSIDYPHSVKWNAVVFSEELKNAVKYGYKVEVKWCIQFERGNPFDEYIKNVYELKLKATNDKNKVLRYIAKMMLNSLYGRMGMKKEFSSTKIRNKNEINDDVKYNNWKYIYEYENTDYCLLKTGNLIDSKLIDIMELNQFKKGRYLIDNNLRSTISSVSIASAISAYARISISKFKNMIDNPLIYSDTDSLVLSKELDTSVIGSELGQLKLEHRIEKGIFISPKLYALKTVSDRCSSTNKSNFVIASAGIPNTMLEYQDFENLIKGNDIVKEMTKFYVIHNKGTVKINKGKFTIKGVPLTTLIPLHINNVFKWIENLQKLLARKVVEVKKDKMEKSKIVGHKKE